MDAPQITYALEDDIALIGLNRPEKRNAISDRMIGDLREAVERAGREARVGLLHGHGGVFSAGLDLSEHIRRTPIEGIAHSRLWHRVFDLIERGPIPFVAALQGAVIGGGLELAASAHIRVADASAFFALPEGQRGIFVGGGGSVRIARLCSAARMADMMLTGRVLSAAEAERLNLVQYVVPEGGAIEEGRRLAAKIAGNAAFSNFAIINALPRIQDLSHDDGLFFESLVASFTQVGPEAEGRLRAFLDKKAGKVKAPGES